ncbi:MAG TPA: rod shape-determining protein RodA [Dehalococcoidia bacterium]|jgi:rod shape determining protein RodA|nr:rod shape-determining protein RodA [Dehalococcoidia bacterium]
MISWRDPRPFDFVLLATALALTVYGLLLIYSGSLTASGGSPAEVIKGPVGRQLAFALVGIALCLFVSRLDYRFLAAGSAGMYLGLIAILLFVLAVGESEFGSKRWIDIGGQRLQPSEIGKLVVILGLAKYLSDNAERVKELSVFLTSLAMAAVPALLVFAEPDLGSASIFLFVWLGMVIMAGADMRHVLGSIGMVVAMAPFGLIIVVTEYQRERVSLFLDPTRDALGSGFNILQAEISVGSGGLFGKGLTHGSQTQLDYLRTQTTDYVFSVLGEELGFVGAVVLFSLFILLLFRGLRAAAISQDVFGRMIAVGIVIFVLFQAFINIGVNIRLFPVTGIPLPFISQGGSSLVTVFIAIGLLESVIMRHRQVSL